MRHDAAWKRTLRRGVRQLLGVPEEESFQTYVGERGIRAVRSLERLLQGLGIAPPRGEHAGDAGTARVVRPEPKKFDLGPGVDRGPAREQIPWGYGENRVTAMPVDPDRLYVYWEITDDAIASARDALGEAGESAWPSLRVYDVTGRIFDGTNAHAYFDHRVERHDRQWFFSLGRPGSTVCVDVGMKSVEGYFARIARSGRVDLPRASAAPPARVEWMTVRAQSGQIEGGHAEAAPRFEAHASYTNNGDHAAANAGADRAARREPPDRVAPDPSRPGAEVDGRVDGAPRTWHGSRRRTEWAGGVERTSWQAGPFPHSVTPPSYEVTEQRSGVARTVETGQGRIVLEQPWSVTIRGIGAYASRRVIGRWEIVRALPAASVREDEHAAPAPRVEHVTLGGSESLVSRGASERRFVGGSEERLGGASEEFLVGASELRYGGASERVLGGASESRWVGASERRWQGASELLHAGASERLVSGGSEERLAGDSPGWQAAGASELRAGGSELRIGGSEPRLAAASANRPGPVAGERDARASWQAFAAAGSRLAPPRAETGPRSATGSRAATSLPSGKNGSGSASG